MNKSPVLLGQILQRMVKSERLLIVDEAGNESYRGFVANFEYSALDKLKPVKEMRLETNVFRRGNLLARVPQVKKEAVQIDDPSKFCFSDLEFVIYIKITLESI